MNEVTWMEKGRCSTAQVNPDWFFPEQGGQATVTAAKFVCAGCPVKDQCLAFALDNMDIWEVGREGIWGGTTAKERKDMLLRLGQLRLTGHGYRSGRPKSRVSA